MNQITAHEPGEPLLSDPEEAFRDADRAEARWRARELQKRPQPVMVELSPTEYRLLEGLAQRQGKTVPQLTQALLQSILSTLLPSAQAASSSTSP